MISVDTFASESERQDRWGAACACHSVRCLYTAVERLLLKTSFFPLLACAPGRRCRHLSLCRYFYEKITGETDSEKEKYLLSKALSLLRSARETWWKLYSLCCTLEQLSASMINTSSKARRENLSQRTSFHFPLLLCTCVARAAEVLLVERQTTLAVASASVRLRCSAGSYRSKEIYESSFDVYECECHSFLFYRKNTTFTSSFFSSEEVSIQSST